MNKKQGWYKEPVRHSLSSKGIETTTKSDKGLRAFAQDLDTEIQDEYYRGVDSLFDLEESIRGTYGEERAKQFGVTGGLTTYWKSAKDFARNKASHREAGIPIVITYDGEGLAELNDKIIHAEPTVEWLENNPRIFHAIRPNAKMTDDSLICARNRLEKEKEALTTGLMKVHPDIVEGITVFYNPTTGSEEEIKERIFDGDFLSDIHDFDIPEEIVDKIEVKPIR